MEGGFMDKITADGKFEFEIFSLPHSCCKKKKKNVNENDNIL